MTGAGSLSPSPYPSWPPKPPSHSPGAQGPSEQGGNALSAPDRVRDGSPKGEDPQSGASAPAENPAEGTLISTHLRFAIECAACAMPTNSM